MNKTKGIDWEVELSDLLNEGQEWMDWLIAPAQKFGWVVGFFGKVTLLSFFIFYLKFTMKSFTIPHMCQNLSHVLEDRVKWIPNDPIAHEMKWDYAYRRYVALSCIRFWVNHIDSIFQERTYMFFQRAGAKETGVLNESLYFSVMTTLIDK